MNHLTKTLFIVSLTSILGCFSNQTGQVGEEVVTPTCTVAMAETVQDDFVTPEGYTLQEALTNLTADVNGVMVWSDDSETDATLTFEVDSTSIEYLTKDTELLSDQASGPDRCSNQLSIPVVMSLSTVDQRLNERYEVTLLVSDEAWGDIDIKPQSYTGTLDLTDFDSGTDGTLASRIEVRFRQNEKLVQVRGSFTKEENGFAMLRLFEIGELRLPQTL